MQTFCFYSLNLLFDDVLDAVAVVIQTSTLPTPPLVIKNI